MNRHAKKYIAPIIIVCLIIVYYSTIAYTMFTFRIPLILKILIVVISLAVSIALLFVLIERIKEINHGEEDDLGEY